MKSLVLLLSMLTASIAQADVQALIPSGYELARTYAELNGSPGASKGSVIEHDFNNDGLLDVAMLVERRSCYGTIQGDQCVGDYWSWGGEDRTLLIFLKVPQGAYNLFLKTQNVIMGDGDGGMANRDPLVEFSVNSKGTILLSYWSGSMTKWGYDIRIQYRNEKTGADFYVVGHTFMSQDWADTTDGDPDMLTTEVDRNLITGDVVTKTYLMSDEKEKIVKSKDKKPLVKVRNAGEGIFW